MKQPTESSYDKNNRFVFIGTVRNGYDVGLWLDFKGFGVFTLIIWYDLSLLKNWPCVVEKILKKLCVMMCLASDRVNSMLVNKKFEMPMILLEKICLRENSIKNFNRKFFVVYF